MVKEFGKSITRILSATDIQVTMKTIRKTGTVSFTGSLAMFTRATILMMREMAMVR